MTYESARPCAKRSLFKTTVPVVDHFEIWRLPIFPSWNRRGGCAARINDSPKKRADGVVDQVTRSHVINRPVWRRRGLMFCLPPTFRLILS